MSTQQVDVQEQLNQSSRYFEADFIDLDTYEENEIPDAVHYANLAELRRLRQEMRTLLTLSDALGAVLTNAEKAQTYLAPHRARVSSRRKSANEVMQAQG